MGLCNMLPDVSIVVLLSPVFPCCRAVLTLVFLQITPRAFKDGEMFILQSFIPDEILGVTCITRAVFLMPIIGGVRHYCWVQFKLRHIY